jgi:mRNA interferase MazF
MSPTSRDEPRCGEVWWIAFDPATGGEIRRTRPALVISTDAANRLLNRIQVVPLTSRIDHLCPDEAYVILEGQRRKAMADQITTAPKLRRRRQIGRLDAADMMAVARAIRTQLAL